MGLEMGSESQSLSVGSESQSPSVQSQTGSFSWFSVRFRIEFRIGICKSNRVKNSPIANGDRNSTPKVTIFAYRVEVGRFEEARCEAGSNGLNGSFGWLSRLVGLNGCLDWLV